MSSRISAPFAAAAVAIATVALQPLESQARSRAAQTERSADSIPPGAWPHAGRDHAQRRFSPLDSITADNVATLRVAWTFEADVAGPYEGNPLVIGDRMYLHTPFPNAVYALDLTQPGSPPLWTWHAPISPRQSVAAGCCDVGSRGLAYHASGKLYVPLFHGELAALDAANGREIWRVRNVDPRQGGSMPGAPLVAGDLVIVGSGGWEYGVRGHVTAYAAANGRLVWRGYHTGPDAEVLLEGDANSRYSSHRGPDRGVGTWLADGWKLGGATASGWLSYDAGLDLVYYGTDPPAPRNPAGRPGENKWSSTIFARSATTGRVRWALQLTPRDEWGYGASNEPILADLRIGGQSVRALVHFDANGFAYTIDRVSGTLLLTERLGPANWAARIDPATAVPVRNPRYAVGDGPVSGVCPAAAGMKGLAPAAFSPGPSRFFVPLNNLCMTIRPTEATYVPGKVYSGATIQMVAGPGGNRGRFIAWDATTGAIAWEVREELAVTGGALVTAGGLVFYGTMDGWLKAVDVTHGRELWRFKTPGGIVGSPITYLGPDGRQYVAVLSGPGGWLGRGGSGAFPEFTDQVPARGTLTVFTR